MVKAKATARMKKSVAKKEKAKVMEESRPPQLQAKRGRGRPVGSTKAARKAANASRRKAEAALNRAKAELATAEMLNDELSKRYKKFQKFSARREAHDFSGHGRSACKKCNRNVGRRATADAQFCHFACPEKTVYCSARCKGADRHKCKLYEYQEKPGSDPKTAEMRSTTLFRMEDAVVADMPIILEIPRVAHYKNENFPYNSVRDIPCIECGIVNQEEWAEVKKGTRRYAIVDKVHVQDCKKCQWPVCPACKKKFHGKECKDLTAFTRSFQARGLQHPMKVDQDRAFWVLGLMRLSIMKNRTGKKDLFEYFEQLMNDRDSSNFELATQDKEYYRTFMDKFSSHFCAFSNWSIMEIKRIMDAFLYYRVHAASISWASPKVGFINKCVLIGAKFHFGCIPNVILVKENGVNRVLLKTLRPVENHEILSLGIYQYGASALIANPIFEPWIGIGDLLAEQGPDHKKECTSSACTICLGPMANNEKQFHALQNLWKCDTQCCEKDKLSYYYPEVEIKALGKRSVTWTCDKCAKVKSLNLSTVRRLRFKHRGNDILRAVCKSDLNTLGITVARVYKNTQDFYRLERIIILVAIIGKIRRLVDERIEKADYAKLHGHRLLKRGEYKSVKMIHDIYFALLKDIKDPDLFRLETAEVKWLESICYIFTNVSEEGKNIDYCGKNMEFLQATKNAEIRTGIPYFASVEGEILNIIKARLESSVERLCNA